MLLLVLTLIALSWMTLDLRAPVGAASAAPRRTALAVFAPVQQILATALRPIDTAVRWVGDQRRLHEQLDALRDETAELRAAAAHKADLADENRRLRGLLAMRARLEHRTVGARVLGTPPGDPGGTVLIDVGADRGVLPDMPVVSHGGGLVGRVVAVSPSHARVEVLTSPAARYAVRVTPGGVPGRLRGTGAGTLRLELDDPHQSVATAASVVTRAFEGSTMPDGVAVGTVVGVGRDRYLDVRPLVAPAGIDLVQVVVGPPTAVPADGSIPAVGSSHDGAHRSALPPPPRPSER